MWTEEGKQPMAYLEQEDLSEVGLMRVTGPDSFSIFCNKLLPPPGPWGHSVGKLHSCGCGLQGVRRAEKKSVPSASCSTWTLAH